MPLKKISFKPGVNRENTRYTNEGGWYDCDKIRFRQGTPEKIGGWQRFNTNTFLGVCRSIWAWSTLVGAKYIGLGTNLKFYIYYDPSYTDVTPIRRTQVLSANPFSTTNGSPSVTVSDTAHGASAGDFVTFTGATAVAGLTISGNYQILSAVTNSYVIIASSNANATTTGGGTPTATYEINSGATVTTPVSGFGAGTYSTGVYGTGGASSVSIRIWSMGNFGEDLVFGYMGGAPYYWVAASGLGTRGVALSSRPGASDVPLYQNLLLVSSNRFVIFFGTNDIGSSTLDPMLVRWSDQESAVNWTPAATNQAGSFRLSHGSQISAAVQTRQEILVFTDVALYSMQYIGAPAVWSNTVLADNITIINDRSVAYASGMVYWMGVDKFYVYNGRVDNLVCDLKQYIFDDFNYNQSQQVFAAVLEKFNEVWWFYCSGSSSTIDKYVIYNYVEKAWYYGSMARTAWMDAGIFSKYPVAVNYNGQLLYHEIGEDDVSGNSPVAITAYVTSSEFDIDDGHHFGFIWRILPDTSFKGSSSSTPSLTMSLLPLSNSGSGYNSPLSQGGSNQADVTQIVSVPVEQYTGEVFVRVRCRQMSFKVTSTGLGVQWQLGSPRIDIRPDGRK
jgi:hypothetical protein